MRNFWFWLILLSLKEQSTESNILHFQWFYWSPHQSLEIITLWDSKNKDRVKVHKKNVTSYPSRHYRIGRSDVNIETNHIQLTRELITMCRTWFLENKRGFWYPSQQLLKNMSGHSAFISAKLFLSQREKELSKTHFHLGSQSVKQSELEELQIWKGFTFCSLLPSIFYKLPFCIVFMLPS